MSESGVSNKKTVLLLITVFSVIVLLFCVVRLCIYSLTSYHEAKVNATLKGMVGESSIVLTQDLETGRPCITVSGTSSASPAVAGEAAAPLSKYKTLYEINPDIAGWIYIEGTDIDYPVMLTAEDEEFYLHRDFYRNDAKSGLPFMDNRCTINVPGSNTIIYGHNMKDGSMFADLIEYASPKYYRDHRYIRFDTIFEEAIYEVVAVFRVRVPADDNSEFKFYNFLSASSEDDFKQYYDKIRSLSLYDIDATAFSTDCLLTLSTCDHTVDDGRFVVVARKIQKANSDL